MSRFMPSVMEYAFATRSPAHASMQYAPTARSMLSCTPRALMSSLVRPRVESTCISMSCCLSRYSSPVFFISGAVALRPERNATARAMSMAMERKRFLLFFISLMRSFLKAVTVPSPFLCVFYKMRLPFYAFYRSWVVVVFLMGNGAVFYMYNVVRHGGEGAVVGYHNHGNALLAAGILQKLQYGLTGDVIQRTGRFIAKQKLGVFGQCAGNGYAQRMSGRSASARAIATRCCSPPES